jgi:hypothetical protein
MNVYKAINRVQTALARSGIGKDSTNTYDNYKFRGIDAVYNAMSPLLASEGLCILPRMLTRTCEERQSQKGGALFYVTVEAEFDLVCAEDGSKHTVRTFGEAMDRGDKATNKAMSAAYKYAAFQTFAIPTEGDNDADSASHEVVSARHKPTELAKGTLSPEQHAFVSKIAGAIGTKFGAGEDWGAYEEMASAIELIRSRGGDDNQFQIALFDVLPANQRAALKSLQDAERVKQQAIQQAQQAAA